MAFQTDIDVSRLLRDNKYLKQIEEHALLALIDQYPQSYMFKAILLKKYKLEENPKFEPYLQEVSFYAPNRRGLYFFLKDDVLEADDSIDEIQLDKLTTVESTEEIIEVEIEESEAQVLESDLISKKSKLEEAEAEKLELNKNELVSLSEESVIDDSEELLISENKLEKEEEETEKKELTAKEKEKKKRKKEKKKEKKKAKREKKKKEKKKAAKLKKKAEKIAEREASEVEPVEDIAIVLPDLGLKRTDELDTESPSLVEGLPTEFLKEEEKESLLAEKVKPPVLSSDQKKVKKKEENFKEPKPKEETLSGHHSFLDWLDIVDASKSVVPDIKESGLAASFEKEQDEPMMELEKQYASDRDFLHPEELKKVEHVSPKFKKVKKKTKKTGSPEDSVKKLAKDSVEFNSAVMTETLAKVMEIQGKTERAIEIYSALSLKYPEKSSFFAVQIKRLKNKT